MKRIINKFDDAHWSTADITRFIVMLGLAGGFILGALLGGLMDHKGYSELTSVLSALLWGLVL